jgi:glycosyltransferase involved in cell wall biosynthesis
LDSPLFSVILPAYNGERYLREAVESVRAQTCADWELLALDDGSKDSSPAVLEALAANDPRIRVERRQNGGVAAARNRGLSMARGKYVTFLDQDDLLHPRALERFAAAFAATSADAVSGRAYDFLTTGGAMRFFENCAPSGVPSVSETPVHEVLHPRPKAPGVRASVWARAYLRSAIAGLSFPDGVFGADDWVFTMRVMAKIGRHATLEDVVYMHRSHPDNISSAMPMRYILAMLGAVETVAAEWCDAGPRVPRDEFARALAGHVQLWGLLLPCLKVYSRDEDHALGKALLRLRRMGLLPFSSAGHALRYVLVRIGWKRLLPALWPGRFRKMATARANHAEEVG